MQSSVTAAKLVLIASLQVQCGWGTQSLGGPFSEQGRRTTLIQIEAHLSYQCSLCETPRLHPVLIGDILSFLDILDFSALVWLA